METVKDTSYSGEINRAALKKMLPCIYKITNPNGRMYIGQSVNVWRRYITYRSNHQSVEKQIKLYKSFQKYGFEEHKFEIILQCDREFLNENELFYINKYNSTNRQGLNCQGGGDSIHTQSKESIEKRALKLRGKIPSAEKREKIGNANRGVLNGMYNKIPWNLGTPHSVETKMKLSLIGKEHYKNNPGYGRKGSKHTPESLKLISENTKGKNVGITSHSFKGFVIVHDIDGEYVGRYEGLTPAAKALRITFQGISKAILRNKPFKGYVFKREPLIKQDGHFF